MKYKKRATSNEDAFAIIELLIALAITGLLLAAVAVAFDASVMSYRQNEDIFKAVNNVRQALYRITSQLRTGYNINISDPDNRCTFSTTGGESITYEYRSADGKLYLITNSDGQEYVLCENVTSMTFIKTPTDDGLDAKNVQISITVESGDIQRTASAAAVIRKNLN